MARDQKLVLETQEKSTINTVTTLSELLEKYGNNAKILKIKFSQLISLIKCCKSNIYFYVSLQIISRSHVNLWFFEDHIQIFYVQLSP